MRGVRHETTLGDQRGLQAVVGILELTQHLVETVLQPPDLVGRFGFWQAAAEVLGAADILGGRGHGIERAERSAGQPPARGSRREQRQQPTGNQEEPQPAQFALDAGK
ncbi:MAG: hypothetical protein E6J25_05455 [Chloroflexi bacterium]|nr:MAG: hypothetical protein E6J25_05455 [Chloroflexota bacterium]